LHDTLGGELTGARVPPNVKFELDDVESPWLYNSTFDFIFSRYMAGSILDWPKFIGNVYESGTPLSSRNHGR